MISREQRRITMRYLDKVRLLDIRINQRIREAEELKTMALRVSSVDTSKEPVQTSPASDAVTHMIDRYVDLQQEIDRMIDRYVALKHKIIGEIQLLDNHKSAALLFKRYVEYKTITQIAGEMHYSYAYTSGLHLQALSDFCESTKLLKQS